ncbi:SMP-30/gluconolactonase/LRE family protein [Sphingobium cloacae]|uniref:SMP-30/Gluconolactonase/LRE-like region domain-containing protein n=1 Tax=Sphingobium cloacae TaxID=120107 RepID=A0A1E1F524_9SPHN|nr:SMP-30/gluconolactonase/LRE family protein [Sphingobium cloacae]BAV65616.1 hypothetical protein SCLO_1025760 [Sphingobium cloacae]
MKEYLTAHMAWRHAMTIGLLLAAPPVAAQPRSFGGFQIPESAVYDEGRDAYLVASMGAGDAGFISIVNPDGTLRQRDWLADGKDGVQLVRPFGSEIHKGIFYVADTPFVRSFDMASGKPLRSVRVEGATVLNDLAISSDGTVYVTDMGDRSKSVAGGIYRIAPDGTVSLFVSGKEAANPNGIAIDASGNIANVAMSSPRLFLRSPEGQLLSSIDLGYERNDGIIVLEDGSIIISSLGGGTLLRVGPDGNVSPLAAIDSPASIGFDSKRRVIIVPQLRRNSLTLVPLPR